MTKEEAAKSIDKGKFYRIPDDNRDLNYAKYLEDGSPKISLTDEYNSNNTQILSIDEIKEKLLTLDEVKAELLTWRRK